MIKRKIFLIKGFSKTDKEKIEDEYYIKSCFNYFNQSVGGAYYYDEMVVLYEPLSSELEKIILSENLDFGIMVFIGHGANQDDNQIFQLNKNEIIKPGQYTLNSEKQIIILESCRVISENIPVVDLGDKIPKFQNGGIVRHPLTKTQAREVYDSHIKRCKAGIMICYACKLGFEAFNFIFSKSFLQIAMDWHLDSGRHCSILPIDELMRLTWAETIIESKDLFGVAQIPHSEGNINFPIAVSKF
ncbi:caspase family protein [Cloacibacterium normanense]|uniref:caspase family protein n=1 Tax=Cloacibacterium normanense TaxID=237258 RepID=UPI0035AE9CF6